MDNGHQDLLRRLMEIFTGTAIDDMFIFKGTIQLTEEEMEGLATDIEGDDG
jgi:hypothetical protein